MIDNVDAYLPYVFYKGEMEGVAIKTEPDSESRRGANILKLRVQLNQRASCHSKSSFISEPSMLTDTLAQKYSTDFETSSYVRQHDLPICISDLTVITVTFPQITVGWL